MGHGRLTHLLPRGIVILMQRLPHTLDHKVRADSTRGLDTHQWTPSVEGIGLGWREEKEGGGCVVRKLLISETRALDLGDFLFWGFFFFFLLLGFLFVLGIFILFWEIFRDIKLGNTWPRPSRKYRDISPKIYRDISPNLEIYRESWFEGSKRDCPAKIGTVGMSDTANFKRCTYQIDGFKLF